MAHKNHYQSSPINDDNSMELMWLRIQNFSLVIDICDVFSQPNHERTPVEEMKEAEEQGSFTFVHGPSQDEVDEEEFEEAPDTTEPVKVTLHGPVTT